MTTSRVLISEQTGRDLDVVAAFFGIDLEWNRHIFRFAAGEDGRAFEVVIRAMAVAISLDARHGTAARIRNKIATAKGEK